MWNIFPDQLEPLLLITLLSDVPCKQRDRWSERASESGCVDFTQPWISDSSFWNILSLSLPVLESLSKVELACSILRM